MLENSYPKALRTQILRFLVPKDHTMQGFWAILSLRVIGFTLIGLGVLLVGS